MSVTASKNGKQWIYNCYTFQMLLLYDVGSSSIRLTPPLLLPPILALSRAEEEEEEELKAFKLEEEENSISSLSSRLGINLRGKSIYIIGGHAVYFFFCSGEQEVG